jgi:hypothetical protein
MVETINKQRNNGQERDKEKRERKNIFKIKKNSISRHQIIP